MAKFRKLPVIIDAHRLTKAEGPQVIATREGSIMGYPGDWLITGVENEKYPCNDAIFRKTYQAVDAEGEAELAKVIAGLSA